VDSVSEATYVGEKYGAGGCKGAHLILYLLKYAVAVDRRMVGWEASWVGAAQRRQWSLRRGICRRRKARTGLYGLEEW